MRLAALRVVRGAVIAATVTTTIVAAATVVVGIVLAGGLEFVTAAEILLVAVGCELVVAASIPVSGWLWVRLAGRSTIVRTVAERRRGLIAGR